MLETRRGDVATANPPRGSQLRPNAAGAAPQEATRCFRSEMPLAGQDEALEMTYIRGRSLST